MKLFISFYVVRLKGYINGGTTETPVQYDDMRW